MRSWFSKERRISKIIVTCPFDSRRSRWWPVQKKSSTGIVEWKRTVTREMKALERSQTARVSWHNDGDNGHRWKFARRRDAEAFVSVMRAGNKNLSSRFHGGNVARRALPHSRTGKFPRKRSYFFFFSFSSPRVLSTFLELNRIPG